MSVNTVSQNKLRQSLHEFDEIWVFGYGSLIYKVDFPYIEKTAASIKGWQRRFWQGSHDHRGTPQQPGRVVTLIQSDVDQCSGIAYKVTQDVFDHLDDREKNGYLRYEVEICLKNQALDNRTTRNIKGLVYIAPKDNAAFLGEASVQEIAQHIHGSSGLSGHNRDYVFQLAVALQDLGDEDEHVISIDRILKQLNQSS